MAKIKTIIMNNKKCILKMNEFIRILLYTNKNLTFT